MRKEIKLLCVFFSFSSPEQILRWGDERRSEKRNWCSLWCLRERVVWRLTGSRRNGEAGSEWVDIRGFPIHFRHLLPCYCLITIVAKDVSSGELLGGHSCWWGDALATPFFSFLVDSNVRTRRDLADYFYIEMWWAPVWSKLARGWGTSVIDTRDGDGGTGWGGWNFI